MATRWRLASPRKVVVPMGVGWHGRQHREFPGQELSYSASSAAQQG